MATHTLGRQRRPAVRHPALENPPSLCPATALSKHRNRRRRFLDFCDTVQRHSLHPAIISLRIATRHPLHEPYWTDHGGRILHFFRSTTRIKTLFATSLPNLSSVLFSPQFASACLPRVRILDVSVHAVDLQKLSRFRRFYSQLTFLNITMVDEGSERIEHDWIGQTSDFDNEELPPDRVETLTVIGQVDSPSFPPFIHSFDAIDCFGLGVKFATDLPIILSNLQPSLRRLAVHSLETLPPLDAAILRLPTLQSLSLSGRIFTQNLLPDLSRLPNLVQLSIDNNPNITLSALEPLLVEPTKWRSLKRLIIFSPFKDDIKRGPSRLDGDEFILDDFLLRFVPPRSWSPPRWPNEFPREDVASFISLADAAGVDIGGHLQHALGIEYDYALELEACEVYSRTGEGMMRLDEARAKSRVHSPEL